MGGVDGPANSSASLSRSASSSEGSSLPIDKSDGTAMERGTWGGKFEFLLTCIGYAVGLGPVWRFPYIVYRNGGGAFIIPFIIMLFVIGIPMFFMELCWAQFASLGPITIWNMNPMMKGLGFSMVLTVLMVDLYYGVVVSWCIYFLFASFNSELPWKSCNNNWNTVYCWPSDEYINLTDLVTLKNNVTVNRSELQSPSYEFFYRKVLQMSYDIDDSGTVVWQLALCLFLTWFIIFIVLIKGVGSLGKVVYFFSLFPYLLLTIMLVRGLTLEGAGAGIEYYLVPDWSKLSKPEVWSNAATQIFYGLGIGFGGLLAMASYNPFHNNTLRDSMIVPVVQVLTSIYAGFVIFAVLGYMAELKGVSVENVTSSGPGLVFIVYPEGLTTMPVSPLWSILFFCMMLMLGLSSLFSMVECVFSGFMDEYPSILRTNYLRTVVFRGVSCFAFFLISLPMLTNNGFYVFTVWDKYTGDFPLLIIAVFEILSIVYIYGYNNFANDIEMMLGKRPNIVFRICWMAVTPIIILAIIIFTAIGYEPPSLGLVAQSSAWVEVLGWCIVTVCVICIPTVFVYKFMRAGGAAVLYKVTRPTAAWGPADPANRTGRYAPDVESSMIASAALSLDTNNVKCSEDESECKKDAVVNQSYTGDDNF